MATPTDTGIAVVTKAVDGTKTVSVSVDYRDGKRIDVMAIHLRRSAVEIDGAVTVHGSGDLLYSAHPVHVYADDAGVVHIDPPSQDGGPLLKRLRPGLLEGR